MAVYTQAHQDDNKLHTLVFTTAQLAMLRGILDATMDGSDRCADNVGEMLDQLLPIDEALAEDEEALDAHNTAQWEALGEVLAIVQNAE